MSFSVGDLVWAKMKGFPPWPGLVTDPPQEMTKKPNKKNVSYRCIFFFGSKNYGWIDEGGLKHYVKFKDSLSKSGKSSGFRDACAAIEEYYKKKESGETVNVTMEEEDEAFDRLMGSTSTPVPKKKGKKGGDEPVEGAEPPKRKGRPKKNPDAPPKRALSPASLPVSKKKRQVRQASEDSLSGGRGDEAPYGSSPPYRRGPGSNLLDRPPNISRPETPPLNLDIVSQTLKEKNITPSPLKFGFLGLGIMGSGIVKNLLNSGHKVIVWNRSPEKSQEFVKAGAEMAITPSDVVGSADITFSCVSDPQAAKDMVFGNCGVLTEMNSSKAYVEMTGIDADTSCDIGEAVTSKGGRYLEAQMQGSKKQAEEGTVVILAAGDRSEILH
jgi:3-hydroxyisobutyrate dehydrogenase